MATRPPTRAPEPPQLVLSRAQQTFIGGLVALSLVIILGGWFYRGGHRGELIEIDRAAPLPLEYRVDLNQADWPELAQLPGIGETLARRIVESRVQEGPYLQPADLQRVRGIGPRTLERVRPYLSPLAPGNVAQDAPP